MGEVLALALALAWEGSGGGEMRACVACVRLIFLDFEFESIHACVREDPLWIFRK